MIGPGRPPDRGPLVARPPVTHTGVGPAFPHLNPGVPKAPAQKPLWAMTPTELQHLAYTMAQQYYGASISEGHAQQARQASEAAANNAGLAALTQAIQQHTLGYADQVRQAYEQAGRGVQGSGSDAEGAFQKAYQQGAAGAPGLSQAYSDAAGNQGQIQFMQAVQAQNASRDDLNRQVARLVGQQGAKAQSIYGDLAGQQDKYRAAQQRDQASQDSLTLRRATYYAGRADKLNQEPSVPYLYGSNADGVFIFKDAKGKPVLKNASYTYRSGGPGQTQVIDKATGQLVNVIGNPTPPKPPPADKPPATIPTGKGGRAAWVHDANGWHLVQVVKPQPGKTTAPKQVIIGPGGAPLTATQINDYGATVRQTVYSPKGRSKGLAANIDLLTQEGIPEAIWLPIVTKAYNIPTSLKDINHMALPRLRNLAIMMGWRPDPAAAPRKGGLAKSEFIQWIQQSVHNSSGYGTAPGPQVP